MVKKSLISEEEKQLFRDAVKKLSRVPARPTHSATKHQHVKFSDDEIPSRPFASREYQEPASLAAHETIEFYRAGLQQQVIKKLRRGQIKVAATLDLHRKTLAQVELILEPFIQNCRQNKIRCVNIIHGKGYHSKEGAPILKNVLAEWLRNHPDVLAYHSAKPRDGGTGALYVLLKSKSEHHS